LANFIKKIEKNFAFFYGKTRMAGKIEKYYYRYCLNKMKE